MSCNPVARFALFVAILTGAFCASNAQAQITLLSEDFEGVQLKDASSPTEQAAPAAWTEVPPAGWNRDNSTTPIGSPVEFQGWTFMKKDYWSTTAGDQQRSTFAAGQGVVAVADADEYDDGTNIDDMLYNVFLETPSNPLTEIADIRALTATAHARGVLVAVDNCFCTPILQKPLELGADLVIHSATKFLDGQGRVLGGAVCGARTLTEEVFKFLRTAGPTLSAFNAWVLIKGLETLRIRIEAQSASALQLAQWLEGHPKMARVFYPGLPSHPDHDVARKQMHGFGGVVSFEIEGDGMAAARFIDAVRLPHIAPSLGGVDSLIEQPAIMSYFDTDPEVRLAMGISDELVRFAIGIEDTDDLITDLEQALAQA